MATYIPAIRGRMGDLDYFVAITTLGEAARMVDYVEEIDGWTPETPAEMKLQRKLNIQRVEREMVPYLLGNDDRFYSALTVEVRPATPPLEGAECIQFEAREQFPAGVAFGVITLDGTEAIYALDGQHRLKSIELALRQEPRLAREQVALILVPFRTISRSQTLFSDLNRYARGPSKSMSLLFTHREALARISKALAHSVPLLRDRVNMESTSLSSNSRHFITLSTLYEMTKAMLGDKDASGINEAEVAREFHLVWEVLTKAIEEWRLVETGQEHPAYLRQRFLNVHGVAQQAIACATAEARNHLQDRWEDVIGVTFGSIDWRLNNAEWQGVALHGGRVNNTATSIRMLSALLQSKMGISTKLTRRRGSTSTEQLVASQSKQRVEAPDSVVAS
jgi:DNA sulfur modification protein DndB